MDIRVVEHHTDRRVLDQVEVTANGTTITVSESAGRALTILIAGPDGGRLIDLTLRSGPSGAD
jgi:methylglyoxal synthase